MKDADILGKYKEIFRLKKMLEDEGIMFTWIPHFGYDEEKIKKYPDLVEHYQICYPIYDPKFRYMSVIEGFGTYGSEADKLEIMGRARARRNRRLCRRLAYRRRCIRKNKKTLG